MKPGVTTIRAVVLRKGMPSTECSHKFIIIPVEVPAPTITPDSGIFRDEVDVVISVGSRAEMLTFNVDGQEDVTLVKPDPLHADLRIDRPGSHVIRATSSIRGKYSQTVYSKTSTATLQVANTLYRIPKEIIRGCMTIAGTTHAFLKKNQGHFMSAVHKSLNLSKRSTCKATEIGEAANGGVDVHYQVEVDQEETVTGGQLAAEVMGDGFAGNLAENLAEGGSFINVTASAVSVQSAEVEDLAKIVLHLEWTFPVPGKRDYLDGSCLIYAEEEFKAVVDYAHTSFGQVQDGREGGGAADAAEKKVGTRVIHLGLDNDKVYHITKVNDDGTYDIKERNKTVSAVEDNLLSVVEDAMVKHSGDIMTDQTGKHVLEVDLKGLPPHITDLFFVLSAYNCGDLSLFPNPSVKLYSPKDPSRSLTEFELAQAGSTEATVMNSVSRNIRGHWEMVACNFPSAGTVRDYKPVREAIVPTQRRHVAWRRRKDALKFLIMLRQEGRVIPVIGHEDFTETLFMISALIPTALWRQIFHYV